MMQTCGAGSNWGSADSSTGQVCIHGKQASLVAACKRFIRPQVTCKLRKSTGGPCTCVLPWWSLLGAIAPNVVRKNACKLFTVRSIFFESRAPVRPPDCSSARSCVNPPFFSRTVLRLRVYHCNPTFEQHIDICTMLVNCSGSSTTIS